jgi:hypothetical protein
MFVISDVATQIIRKLVYGAHSFLGINCVRTRVIACMKMCSMLGYLDQAMSLPVSLTFGTPRVHARIFMDICSREGHLAEVQCVL